MSDTSPPTIVSLQFSPPRIHDGEDAAIAIQMFDDLSGVKYVSGTVMSPNGKAMVGFSAQKNGDSDQWIGQVKVPRDAEAGNWYVSTMQLSDKANNATSVGYSGATAPAGWTLVVESSHSDSTPPVLKAAWVDPPGVQEKEKVLVYVQADDDISGVASVSGSFQSPSKKAIVSFGGQLSADLNAWVGTIVIPAGADCGDWTILNLQLTDKARNIASLGSSNPLLSRVIFTVSATGKCDSIPPVLESVGLSPQVVSNEVQSDILVTAVVTDDRTGVASVSGRAEGPKPSGSGTQTPKIYFGCAKSGTDSSAPWVGKITVPKFSAKGTWRITSLQVQDAALNSRTYSAGDPVLGAAIFEVQ